MLTFLNDNVILLCTRVEMSNPGPVHPQDIEDDTYAIAFKGADGTEMLVPLVTLYYREVEKLSDRTDLVSSALFPKLLAFYSARCRTGLS